MVGKAGSFCIKNDIKGIPGALAFIVIIYLRKIIKIRSFPHNNVVFDIFCSLH
jgi:hypothetical protein